MAGEYKRLKTKDIIKRALKHPDLFSEGEIQYFQLMKQLRKDQKKNKAPKSDYLK